MSIPYSKVKGSACSPGGPSCCCCGYPRGDDARRREFRAARKRDDRRAITEGLADMAATTAAEEAEVLEEAKREYEEALLWEAWHRLEEERRWERRRVWDDWDFYQEEDYNFEPIPWDGF